MKVTWINDGPVRIEELVCDGATYTVRIEGRSGRQRAEVLRCDSRPMLDCVGTWDWVSERLWISGAVNDWLTRLSVGIADALRLNPPPPVMSDELKTAVRWLRQRASELLDARDKPETGERARRFEFAANELTRVADRIVEMFGR